MRGGDWVALTGRVYPALGVITPSFYLTGGATLARPFEWPFVELCPSALSALEVHDDRYRHLRLLRTISG